MKARIVVWYIALIVGISRVSAENINGTVVSSQGDFPIHGANITIFRNDSLVYSFNSDKSGKFSISLQNGIYDIHVKKDGYSTLKERLAIATTNGTREMKLTLSKEPRILDEVVVTASPQYVRNLEDGIIYNLSRDKYAQKENLLNALNRVPLLMVSSDGAINVAGKNSYLIYLNGKPYNIANAEPAQVLRSIQAHKIKQVEVITRPANRFGESVPVINIVTKGKSLEGYHLNLNGSGATTPKAKGATSLLGIINKIQFFAGYTYDMWGQRNQQWHHEYKFENGRKMSTTSDKNRMNRHTHVGKALFQWDIDTLKQIYADFHINGIQRNEKIHYEQTVLADMQSSRYVSTSDTWDASLETNIIYSSRFRNSNARKWRVGYRFTLNPDNRNYRINELTDNTNSGAKTKGRLYTHNFQLYRRINFSKKLHSFFSLNANLRQGSALSEYVNGTITDNTDDFRYTQILGSLDWRIMWYLTKTNNLWLDISNKLEYANDKSTDLDTPRQSFSYLPYVKLTWQPDWDNEFSLSLNSSVDRPSLQMLNPFIGGKINNDVLQGSPKLKDSWSGSFSMGYSYYGKKISISPTLTGVFTKNAIMSVYNADKTASQIIETYSNINRVKKLSLELFLSYRPWQWITLRNVSSFGMQNISSHGESLNQSDWFYRSTSVITFNLPKTWKVETRFTCYKLDSKAWIHYSPGILYGVSLSKTLMKGNMFISVFMDNPFDSRGVVNSHTILSSSAVSYDKLWKIQTRAVGIEVSINLQRGKKVGIKRDTSLRDTDIKSGIAN